MSVDNVDNTGAANSQLAVLNALARALITRKTARIKLIPRVIQRSTD